MQSVFDFLFAQYQSYPRVEVILELVAVVFGVLSVYYSRANNILVYPTGLVSTAIFVYLLFKWDLIGDLLVNLYYSIMSVYGWFIWSKKMDSNANQFTPITSINKTNLIQIGLIFLSSIVFVTGIYIYFDKLIVEQNSWIPYVDIFTTAIFFVGMWLMAKRKIEHWYFWILANTISIPLYFIKGHTFTSLQYIIFLVLAILGVISWREIMKEEQTHKL